MDLAELDLTTFAESGFDLTLKNPRKMSEDLDIVISVVGSDSKAFRTAQTKVARKNAENVSKGGEEPAPDELAVPVYAACITGWKNIELDGEVFEYSKENAEVLLGRFPWICDQVGAAIIKRSNFTKPPVKS